jgi:hypothetical protein
MLLRNNVYELTETADGISAVESVYNLIIADFAIPRLQTDRTVPCKNYLRTPILIISGYISERSVKVILQGMADFLSTSSHEDA